MMKGFNDGKLFGRLFVDRIIGIYRPILRLYKIDVFLSFDVINMIEWNSKPISHLTSEIEL